MEMPWEIEDFNLHDELNQVIWSDSIRMQNEIHASCDGNHRRFSGAVGIQQAMIGSSGFDTDPLPMVPDLVGKEAGKCRDKTALIVGSAYAPFIQGIAGRGATIALRDYKTAGSAAKFQQRFFAQVIAGDKAYYEPLALRFSRIRPTRNLIVMDLCRGSFCFRSVDANGLRRDIGGDRIAMGKHFVETGKKELAVEARVLFSCYVDYGADWTWQRMEGSRDIIALGAIAEHGLLRLLDKRGATILDRASGNQWTKLNVENHWSQFSADGRKQHGKWWDAHVGNMEWRILPTPHPAAPTKEAARRDESVRCILGAFQVSGT
jgi:hypothetical protein